MRMDLVLVLVFLFLCVLQLFQFEAWIKFNPNSSTSCWSAFSTLRWANRMIFHGLCCEFFILVVIVVVVVVFVVVYSLGRRR
jgi:hypothetical protein